MPAVIRDKFGRPIRDLRMAVIDKCNFRCPYCMPAEIFGADYNFLSKSELLSDAEIVRLARLFAQAGVTKFRITGGEPLLRPNLPDMIAQLARIPHIEDLAMTTNAAYLVDRAPALKAAGLYRITVSLDSLDNEVFQRMNGRRGTVEQVLAGIEAAKSAGFSNIKINCVVKRGVNDHTIVEMARFFKGSGYVIRFIEYMDVGNLNGWKMDDVVTASEILQMIDAAMPLEPLDPNYRGEVARRYRYLDGSGEIGLITSVTQPFCGDCTRARLSGAGEYYTCLFAQGGTDLRAPLRRGASDEEILALITSVWQNRTDRYSELRTSFTDIPVKGAEMYRIGG